MESKNIIPCKVLIIGAGPAGLSAAIYTARAGLETIVLSGSALGGQASMTSEIENYPGFPELISGGELTDKFKQQAENFGAKIVFDSAIKADVLHKPFTVESESAIYQPETIIIAMGSRHMLLNVPGEKEFTGRGVSYCATCDGFFYRGKHVAVVGGGNSAVEEALFLTKFASRVSIIHRRDALRADASVQKKAKENPKLDFVWNSIVTEVVGQEKVTAVRLKNVQTGEESLFEADGVFVFTGFRTITDLFEGQVEIENGTFKVNSHMETNISGVYAAGESVDNLYRQVITSAASGAQAGITISKKF